uniref:Uncharacterized protein n=1 Tax=Arundo donax TaxID=35708 RepID=A0A0A9GIP3_ARUDO
MKTPIALPGLKIRDDGPSRKPTYKESLIKGIDPLDGEYIDFKLKEKFEIISSQWKKDIKEEVLKDLRKEMDEKFKNIKKEYEGRLDILISDKDIMDIGGHGQKPE